MNYFFFHSKVFLYCMSWNWSVNFHLVRIISLYWKSLCQSRNRGPCWYSYFQTDQPVFAKYMYMYIISIWDFAYFNIRMSCAFVSWLTKRVKTTFLSFNYSGNLIWLNLSWNQFFSKTDKVCLLSLWFEWHQKWRLTVVFFLK